MTKEAMECMYCNGVAFFINERNELLHVDTGSNVYDGDKAWCGCGAYMSADEEGAELMEGL